MISRKDVKRAEMSVANKSSRGKASLLQLQVIRKATGKKTLGLNLTVNQASKKIQSLRRANDKG